MKIKIFNPEINNLEDSELFEISKNSMFRLKKYLQIQRYRAPLKNILKKVKA